MSWVHQQHSHKVHQVHVFSFPEISQNNVESDRLDYLHERDAQGRVGAKHGLKQGKNATFLRFC